jgi:hypothetical protein
MKRQVTAATAVATPAAATESVIATVNCPALGDNPLISGVVIDGVLDITPGTAATGVTIKCHRNTLGGAQVGPTLTIPGAAAGALSSRAFAMFDNAPTGGTYVITQTAAAQSGAGTVGSIVVTATAS